MGNSNFFKVVEIKGGVEIPAGDVKKVINDINLICPKWQCYLYNSFKKEVFILIFIIIFI